MTDRAALPADVQQRIHELAVAFANIRSCRGMSLREVTDQCGVSFVALSRFERGQTLSLAGLVAVLAWLHLPLSWLSGDGDDLVAAYRRGWDDRTAAIRAALDDKPRTESETTR